MPAHERPGPSDRPLSIHGAHSGNSSEPLSMGRLFRPQASHARAIPGVWRSLSLPP